MLLHTLKLLKDMTISLTTKLINSISTITSNIYSWFLGLFKRNASPAGSTSSSASPTPASNTDLPSEFATLLGGKKLIDSILSITSNTYSKFLGLFKRNASPAGSTSSSASPTPASNTDLPSEFATLVTKSNAFFSQLTHNDSLPKDNRANQLITHSTTTYRLTPTAMANRIIENANNTYPLLLANIIPLIKDFLCYKAKYTNQQHAFYQEHLGIPLNASPEQITGNMISNFITRLLTKRPLAFTSIDYDTLPRTNTTCPIDRTTPTEDDYISYDEMQISALLAVSSPSFFINNGFFDQDAQNFIHDGIIIGQGGARFEWPDVMEYQHILITKEQNTIENGYGQGNTDERFKHWAKFYFGNVNYNLYTYEEAEAIYEKDNPDNGVKQAQQAFIRFKEPDSSSSYKYLDVCSYKSLIKQVMATFLIDANARGTKDKPAYVHAIRLGIGAWKIPQISKQLENLLLEVYAEILTKHTFENIADIDFSCFANASSFNGRTVEGVSYTIFQEARKDVVYTNLLNDSPNPSIRIHFSNNEPNVYGENKTIKYMRNKILVTQYDCSGSYLGNDFGCQNNLTGTIRFTAARCSQITELQNPEINKENICGEKARITRNSCGSLDKLPDFLSNGVSNVPQLVNYQHQPTTTANQQDKPGSVIFIAQTQSPTTPDNLKNPPNDGTDQHSSRILQTRMA